MARTHGLSSWASALNPDLKISVSRLTLQCTWVMWHESAIPINTVERHVTCRAIGSRRIHALDLKHFVYVLFYEISCHFESLLVTVFITHTNDLYFYWTWWLIINLLNYLKLVKIMPNFFFSIIIRSVVGEVGLCEALSICKWIFSMIILYRISQMRRLNLINGS